MKKLSIVLALIMALSCFGIVAAAEDTTSTTAAQTTEAPNADATTTSVANANVVVTVNYLDFDGNLESSDTLKFTIAAGSILTSKGVVDAVTNHADFNSKQDTISDVVVWNDDVSTKFVSVKVEAGQTYEFIVTAAEREDVENFANLTATKLAGLDWAGFANANVTLINQIISGFKAAVDSLVSAEWPNAADKTEAAATTTVAADAAVEETPDTGVSAVAGAAVAVLALSAATAVVLRKKED